MHRAANLPAARRLISAFVAVVLTLGGVPGGGTAPGFAYVGEAYTGYDASPRAAITSSTLSSSTLSQAAGVPIPTPTVSTFSVTNPPISITDTDSPDPVTSGTQLTYTIVLTNTGGAQVTNVQITDQFNGLGADVNNPPNLPLTITSSTGNCVQGNYKITCNAGSLAGGQAWTVTVRGVVVAAGGTTLNNTANGSATKSAQTFNVSATTTTQVVAASGGALPDLTVSIAAPSSIVVGAGFSYTLTVNNTGTANAANITVIDTLPSGVVFDSVNATSLFSCTGAPSVTCTGGAVNAGANATITLNVTAPSIAGQITDTATVDPNNTIAESNELNNSASITSTVVASSTTNPLTITNVATPTCAAPDPCTASNSATGGVVVPGATLTYTIVVTNPATNGRADNVVVTDSTQGLDAASLSATTTRGTCTVSAPTVTCSQTSPVLRLQPGESMTITITGTVVASAGTSIVDNATVTANISNTGVSSSASSMMTVKPSYDLSVTLADSPDPVCARSWPAPAPGTLCGGGLAYTIVVGNSGIYDATNVVVRDPLPNDVLFDSFTLSSPSTSGFSCTVETSSNVLTCSNGTVKGQSTATINVLVVPPATTGAITNTVTVDPNNAIPESDESNNTAAQSTQIKTGVDLVVSVADTSTHHASSCSGIPQPCPASAASPKGFNPVATSGTETWVITVNDIGPQDAAGITVQDTLPAGVTFLTASGDHGLTCTNSSGIVTCTGGRLLGTASERYANAAYGLTPGPDPDTATITIVALAIPVEGTMHSEVRVDPGNLIPEIDETNNVATLDTTVQRGGAAMGAVVDLTISKAQTSPAGAVAPNGTLQYTINVGNDGTNSALNVEVLDTLPKGARFIPGKQAATDISNHNFVCAPVPGSDPPQIDCKGGIIPPTTGGAIAPAVNGSEAIIQVTVFAPGTLGTYSNYAVVDPGNQIPEGNEFNNQSNTVSTSVAQGGGNPYNDFTLSMAAAPNGNNPPPDTNFTVAPGGQVTANFSCNGNSLPDDHVCYTLTIGNVGTDPATGIEVKDTIPAGSTFVSATDATGGSGAFSCSQAADGTIDCTGGALSGTVTTLAGIAASRMIQVVVVAPSQHNVHITNTAIVNPTQSIPEADYTNNSASITTLVWSRIDLTISKEGPGSASQNSTITYTITVTNTCVGNPNPSGQPCADARNVQVHDPLPVGVIPLTAYTDPTNAMACQVQQSPINVVDCNGDLNQPSSPAPGATTQVKISVQAFVAANDGTTLNNVATIDPGNLIVESNENNNSSSAVTQTGHPDVTIYKAASNPTVSPGQTQTYTLTVANIGTAQAAQNDVTVTDDFSASGPSQGLLTVSGQPTATNGFTCTVASAIVTCTNSNAALPASGNAVISINTTVGNATAPITNTATVADNDANDTNTADKSASVTTNIGQPTIDLAIASVSDSPDPVAPGQTLTYTIVAQNLGTQTASGVVVRNSLSSTLGITPAGASGSNGFSCQPLSGSNIDCTGNLGPGGSTVITIKLLVGTTTLTPLTLTATIDPNNAFPQDVNRSNNVGSQTTTVTTSGPCTSCKDLTTSIFGSPAPVPNGGTITYSVAVGNIGDTAVQDTNSSDPGAVLVFIDLDPSVTFVSASVPPNSGMASHFFTCGSFPASQVSDPFAFDGHTLACNGDLDAGQGVVITVTATAPAGPADVTTTSTVDPHNTVAEANEGNNTDSVMLHVNP